MHRVAKEVVIKPYGFLGNIRYRILDTVSGGVLYSARYEVSCNDKARRMGWVVVQRKK